MLQTPNDYMMIQRFGRYDVVRHVWISIFKKYMNMIQKVCVAFTDAQSSKLSVCLLFIKFSQYDSTRRKDIRNKK